MSEVQQDELPGLKTTPASDSHSELRSNRSGNADKLSRFFESVSGSLGFSGLTAQSPAASQEVSGVSSGFPSGLACGSGAFRTPSCLRGQIKSCCFPVEIHALN